MRAVIPFRKTRAKSRLGTLLSEKEREDFAIAMLRDVAEALRASGCFHVIDILSTDIIDIDGTNLILTGLGLNEALNEYLRKMSSHLISEPVLIIMADIPLVSPRNIQDMTSSKADIVIAPGRMGGTNSIFIRNPSDFHVDYYGASFLKHCEIAASSGLNIQVFDSFNLSTDIDEACDLTELLLHGKGCASRHLRELGFEISKNSGRVGIKRI